MNEKKTVTLIICLLMVTISFGMTIIKADENDSSSGSGSSPSVGLWYPPEGRISYANGMAMGTNVHFGLDELTGTITNYTVKYTIYPPTYYPQIFSNRPPSAEEYPSNENIMYQNTTLFRSISFDGFIPTAPPNSFAEFLVFQGETIFMQFYDYAGGTMYFAAGNTFTILRFEVPDEFTISRIDPYAYTATIDSSGGIIAPNLPVPIDDNSTLWKNVWIKSNTTEVTISIYNGSVSINGQILEIILHNYGYLNMYSSYLVPAPQSVNDFWYNDLNITQDKPVIENAKNNGTIPAEGWYTKNELQPPATQVSNQIIQGDVTSNYYTYDDPTFNMNFSAIDGTGVNVIVDSQIPTGRIIIINVDKEVLQTTSLEKLLVKFDSTVINPAESLETLMEKVQNKDTDAAYYALSGERLTTVFVYVPHFSSHTISITTLTSAVGEVATILLPFIGSLLFIILIVGGVLLQKKKKRDEF